MVYIFSGLEKSVKILIDEITNYIVSQTEYQI